MNQRDAGELSRDVSDTEDIKTIINELVSELESDSVLGMIRLSIYKDGRIRFVTYGPLADPKVIRQLATLEAAISTLPASRQ